MKIDKSIFRLHRDVRFSKNKEQYKTNLGILFWVGEGKKMESCGLYFHIDSKKFFIATGMYMFTKDQIKMYRELISIEDNGKELNKIIKQIEKKIITLVEKPLRKYLVVMIRNINLQVYFYTAESMLLKNQA